MGESITAAQRARSWRLANRDWVRIARRLYRAANPGKSHGNRAAQRKRWRERNPGRAALDVRQWKRANAPAVHIYNARRRAMRFANGGSYTLQEWRDKCALLGNVCFYCGEVKPLTIDHKIPLTLGGTDDITNILPACATCNSRKHNKTAREFLGLVA